MQYNFDKLTNRRNTFSMKWDVQPNELPLWVADMDFKTAPEIIQAIQQKAASGIFGYTIVPDAYYEAVQGWWHTEHGLTLQTEDILFCTGVVPAISSIVRKLTTPGENILIQPPVYNIFYNSILNNGRNVLESNLVYDGIAYHVDYDDLEAKLSQPQTTMMILCNPHNPIGKVWDRETLHRIGSLCAKHHVLVLSDEIHCDLTHPGYTYTPFASVSEINAANSITCVAPTKAFNLAGLQTASILVQHPVLRHKVNRGINTDEIAEPNAFAMEGTIAAFTKGKPWLEALRLYLQQNIDDAANFIADALPELKVVPAGATYLLWIDCRKLTEDTDRLADFLRAETGLFLSSGHAYGQAGAGFLRMNIACPKDRLTDALHRLKAGCLRFKEQLLVNSSL